jgi:hypothetical protein
MSRQNTWTNSDGLIVGFGRHTDDNDVAAVTGGSGHVKTISVEILGTALVDTIVDGSIPPQAAQIPRGSVIQRATLTTTVAWTGTGTLDIGTWGRGTLATPVVDDADGIDADIDISAALAAVGDTVQCDGALVNGAVTVGETSNSDCVISASWETAVPTAGRAVLTVEYVPPQFDAGLAV